MKRVIAASTALALVFSVQSVKTAEAFCGFYVSGSNKKMFNDATNVVLMRSGTRTVLAMQNDYRGPLEDFAMVVPVPVVLKPTDVKVVPKSAFDKVDSLSSPRLVEYWEQDPCPPQYDDEDRYDRVKVRDRSERTSMKPSVAMADRAAEPKSAPPREPARPAVPPILASFAMHPGTVTAGVATNLTFTYSFSNEPWPTPSCTVDHGVGGAYNGFVKAVSIDDSTNFTLTCANSAGKSTKQFKVNAVKIEAQFDVEEYQIVILSAKEAAGLNDWLKLNGYKIPEGAEPLLRPYIETNSKFFVAKVDPKKVKMVDGRVALSPLRFHYDSDDFSLPIRLGMANSSGKQDLIVNIISPDKRYEVANYKNTFIPTNFNVLPYVKDRFAEFYAALFDKTLEANPGAVVTEYAWQSIASSGGGAGKCDPCPPVIPDDQDLVLLGADIVGGQVAKGGMVLTRLHARYGAKDMKDDLRFKEAKPVQGGREVMKGAWLEYGAVDAPMNNFQARYAVRHWWTGPIRCANPQRQVWGGPPHGGAMLATPAQKTAFVPTRNFPVATVISRDLWEIGLKRVAPAAPTTPTKATAPTTPKKSFWIGFGLLGGLGLLGIGLRTRRRDSL